MSYYITSKETSNVISLICRAQRNRRSSKTDNIEGCRQYGEYLGVMECDINLICDTIKETKKADLFDALEDLIIWYRKMDRIGQAKN
uniref:Uncharacterized protein n=1 Tax=Salmonella phage PMBT35 TaxID=3137287 RepID=A0AAU8BWL1_9VIRU